MSKEEQKLKNINRLKRQRRALTEVLLSIRVDRDVLEDAIGKKTDQIEALERE